MYTVDEYLRLEEAAKTRHEYRGGRIIDRTIGTVDHARIIMNLIVEIGNRVDGTPFILLGSDLRVRTPATDNVAYPDLKIVLKPYLFNPPTEQSTLINPLVLIEVTSPETEVEDRGENCRDYIQIESLQEYIIVCEDRPSVDTFYRHLDGVWVIGPTISELSKTVKLRSLDIEIPLADIYAGIELSPSQIEAKPA